MRRKLEVKIERSAEDMAIDDSKCKNPPQVRLEFSETIQNPSLYRYRYRATQQVV